VSPAQLADFLTKTRNFPETNAQLFIKINITVPKKLKSSTSDVSKDLWVNPKSNLKGDRGERSWENRAGGPPNTSRLLELADIALGLKKPAPAKKKRAAAAGAGSVHTTEKTEPYSG